MKKILVFLLLLFSIIGYSQTQPRKLIGLDPSTFRPGYIWKDTLRTYFYKSPLYVIGDSIYCDTSRFSYWYDNGRTLYYSYPNPSIGAKNVGIGTDTSNGRIEVAIPDINTKVLDSLGIIFSNRKAAVLGTQQPAPHLTFIGHGWGTTAGTSQRVEFRLQQTVTQAGIPTYNFITQRRLGGTGGFTNLTTLDQAGNLTGNQPGATLSFPVVAGTTNVLWTGGFAAGGPTTTTTSVLGLQIAGASFATAAAPVRYSSYSTLKGYVWDSTLSANKSVEFRQELRPATGAGQTTTINYSWYLSSNFNAGTSLDILRVKDNGAFYFLATNTVAGTTGNQTINKTSGTVNIAAGGTAVTVTNSLVTANSIVFAVIRTNDATAQIKSVVPAAGSFVINIVASTGEVSIGWWTIN